MAATKRTTRKTPSNRRAAKRPRLAPGASGDFGVGVLVHDGTLYDADNDFDWDLPFYLAQARRARGPVLELCCGTGRLTVPLAKAGIDISGVDLASSMLDHAKAKARAAGLKIPFHRQDMRRLSLKTRFQLIFIPFNSLQNTYRLADLEHVFSGVRRHLEPGGRFIVDVFNPSIDVIVRGRKLQRGVSRFRLPNGTRVTIDQQTRYDDARQINRVSWTWRGRRRKPLAFLKRCVV